MRIAIVVGARPQFIKAAVISRALRSTKGLEEVIIHTGQHYDDHMSAIFFDELDIPMPEYNLGIGGGTQGAQTGRMLEAVEASLIEIRPDLVFVFGDTNSTLAGALAAAKLHIPIGHVEAGLRSFNRRMPEEINRVLTDHASDLLFAPTATAVANLRREGLPDEKIHLIGDVMYDSALYCRSKANDTSRILARLNLMPQSYILATIHRAENTDDPDRLRAIMQGLGEAASATKLPVILPLHPRTREALTNDKAGAAPGLANLRLIEPVGYLDMIMLEQNAGLIATDSGGVQKEAYFFKVPCVTLRNETEWVELVELGWNRIVPPDSAAHVRQGITAGLKTTPGQEGAPYGDGDAAKKIIEVLLSQGRPD